MNDFKKCRNLLSQKIDVIVSGARLRNQERRIEGGGREKGGGEREGGGREDGTY